MKSLPIKLLIAYMCWIICMRCDAISEQRSTNVNSIRIWPAPENTRIVFDVSDKPIYKLQTLNLPHRIIIDLKNTKLNAQLIKNLNSNSAILGNIKNISTYLYGEMTRIIINLKEQVIVNSFTLTPNERYGNRLVVDLELTEKQKILALFDLDNITENSLPKVSKERSATKLKANNNLSANFKDPIQSKVISKPLIIALDPGHGGEDPGAIGPRGTLEKDIVLAISRKLQAEINTNPRMRAFLIRNGDYYISLEERMLRARRNNADLFLSIHADAFSNSKADGASIFVLSAKGASSAAARWLADSQNRSDTIGGVKIESKKDVLASVLLDLSQTANYAASLDAAKNILISMQKTIPLHKNQVEHASFAVLKAPDVPSVLIETGFISNPQTELKLKQHNYQQRIVKSIIQGINNYFILQPKRVFLHGKEN